MNATKYLGILFATLLITAGPAAAVPDDVSTERNGDGAAGPPTDLPGPVPDFVSDVHESINEFIDGTIDSLGDAVSGATPGGDASTPANGTDA